MKIGIDGRWIDKPSGLGNMGKNLIVELSKIDDENNYVIYLNKAENADLIPKKNNFKTKFIGTFPYPLWEQILLPFHITMDKVDIFHATLGTGPLFTHKVKTLVTIADAMFAMPTDIVPSRKSMYQRLGGAYRSLVIPFIYRRANVIVTISKKAREDLTQYLGSRRKVEVVYLAAGGEFEPGETSSEVKKKLTLPPRFVFSLSASDPRKNTLALVRSYLKSAVSIPLVLVGTTSEEIGREITNPAALNRVLHLGKVSQEDLVQIYRGADIFIYPSLYEAFGIPTLEAMSCGTPVLSSNAGSLVEVGGDAVVYFDPRSEADLIVKLEKLLSDERLRKNLSSRGLVRAKSFPWAKTASQYLNLYKEFAR